MDLESMRSFLIKAQEESFQTRVLNAILSCFEEIENVKIELNETREKVNEVIENWNENAETVNDDIEEDIEVEDIIEEDGDALENEPPRTEE